MRHPWSGWDDSRLLALPLRELRIRLDETLLATRVQRLYRELEDRGILYRPPVWFSTDWFSPDGVGGVAVPFYLAHPRLIRLERRFHVLAEGAHEAECMRLLRHEAGHALDTAYGLSRHRPWREAFGSRSAPYTRTYRANPFSRDHVRHLPRWYAQSHPAEDFAETFAVWLAPRSARDRHLWDRGAVRTKLAAVEELFQRVESRRPPRPRVRPWALSALRSTLEEHYRTHERARKRESRPPFLEFLDSFSIPRGRPGPSPVAAWLDEVSRPLRRSGLPAAGATPYDAEQVLGGMALRARLEGRRWKPGARRPRPVDLRREVRRALELFRRGAVRLSR